MLPINAPILSGTPLRYKLQDLLTQNDVPFAVEINSTHVHDVNFLKQLELLQIYDCQIVADKGYLSIKQHEELLLKHNISIITPWRANMKFMEQWFSMYPKKNGAPLRLKRSFLNYAITSLL